MGPPRLTHYEQAGDYRLTSLITYPALLPGIIQTSRTLSRAVQPGVQYILYGNMPAQGARAASHVVREPHCGNRISMTLLCCLNVHLTYPTLPERPLEVIDVASCTSRVSVRHGKE